MTKVKEIYSFIDSFAPFSAASEWDNSGLLVGSAEKEISKCVVSLDVTMSEIELAEKSGAGLIISHHPVIFHPQKSFCDGNAAFEAAKRNIAVICAHTNLDKAPGGVNDTLCKCLGMTFEKHPEDIADGFINTGVLNFSGDCKSIAQFISKQLNASVRYVPAQKSPARFAVCSGAGGDLFYEAKTLGCDGLITGEASYHEFLDAANAGVTVFAAGHFETENIMVPELINRLSAEFTDVEFLMSERTNFIITEN